MGATKHIADAEAEFLVLNVTPDFCRVVGQIVPFDIMHTLKPEKADYAVSVFARGEKVLMVKSIVQGVVGNAGQGVKSNVSMGSGHVKVVEGSSTVLVESRAVARHGDLVEMNGKVG